MNETMAHLYDEGREANKDAGEEIVRRLEALNNYIPSSDRTRKEYAYVVLREYKEYVQNRSNDKG